VEFYGFRKLFIKKLAKTIEFQFKMKQIFLMLAIIASAISVNAQEDVRESSPSTGDLFEDFTCPLTFNRMIPSYALEVTFTKTVHIIFPAAIRYVDLGSIDLLAAKADGAENVLRVKAATQGFRKESNLSVITEEAVIILSTSSCNRG
jgi:hypothetical protein